MNGYIDTYRQCVGSNWEINPSPPLPSIHDFPLLPVYPTSTPSPTLLQPTLSSTLTLISVILVHHSSRPLVHHHCLSPLPLLDLVKHLSHLFIHLDVLEPGILGCKNPQNWVYSPYQKKKLNHPTQTKRQRQKRNGIVTYRLHFPIHPLTLPLQHPLVKVNQNQDQR
jgi:hypothetical protein